MRLSFGQELRQVQKQVLAPRMIQSMEILQLPILALEERIQQEISENPALELREDESELPDEPREVENPDAPTAEERELVVDEAKDNVDDFERLNNMGDDYPDHFDERSRPSANRLDDDSSRYFDTMANIADRPESLQDHLIEQLVVYDLDPAVRQMVERIIFNLDPNGYLQGSLDDLIDPDAPREQRALAERALAVVQKLEPAGVGARDLRECLLLQLTPETPCHDDLRILISDHLEEIGENRLPLIQKKTQLSLARIQAAIERLHQLNPKPGADYGSAPVPTITPDVFVELDDEGRYRVRLEDGRMPSLRVSNDARQLLASGQTDDKVREFLKRKINSAQWLIEAIEQRRNTLARVAQAIVDHQTEFLNRGPEHIEPLKMQQVADKVGVHVTTVSRAVDDKWMQTPRGIFPLKRFFCGGTTSAAGEEVAWNTIRLKLQEVIDAEDKRAPLSDDDLVQEMSKHGLNLARRTVTKYRKMLKIPSSRQRRDWTLGSAPAGASDGRATHVADDDSADDDE